MALEIMHQWSFRLNPDDSVSIQVIRATERQRELCIDNLLVRIHLIIVMISWTGLAPWEFGR